MLSNKPKTALLLYGNHNMWYLLKDKIYKDIDVFLSVYEIPNLDGVTIKGISVIDKTVPDNRICNRRTDYERESFISNGKKLIDSSKYDNIIIKEFNELVPGVNIISSNCISVNNTIHSIWDTNFSSLLFGGKVCEYNNISFVPSNKDSILFFIPSVIYTDDKNPIANIFTPDERLNQTIEQCKSIRKNVPNSIIYVLEKSPINLHEIHKMSQHVDKLVLFYNDKKCRDISLSPNKNKSIAECYVLNHIVQKIPEDMEYSHLIKFGGRYKLLPDFDVSNSILQEVPTMKELHPQFMYDGNHHVDSIFYSIPKKYKNKYLQCLNDINNHVDVEHCVAHHFKSILKHIPQFRIIGTSAAGVYNMI